MESKYCRVHNGGIWEGKYVSDPHLEHFKHGSNLETTVFCYSTNKPVAGTQN